MGWALQTCDASVSVVSACAAGYTEQANGPGYTKQANGQRCCGDVANAASDATYLVGHGEVRENLERVEATLVRLAIVAHAVGSSDANPVEYLRAPV